MSLSEVRVRICSARRLGKPPYRCAALDVSVKLAATLQTLEHTFVAVVHAPLLRRSSVALCCCARQHLLLANCVRPLCVCVTLFILASNRARRGVVSPWLRLLPCLSSSRRLRSACIAEILSRSWLAHSAFYIWFVVLQ